jgi:hypothetical protein
LQQKCANGFREKQIPSAEGCEGRQARIWHASYDVYSYLSTHAASKQFREFFCESLNPSSAARAMGNTTSSLQIAGRTIKVRAVYDAQTVVQLHTIAQSNCGELFATR